MADVTNVNVMPFGSEFTYNNINVSLNLPGKHQIENMVAVIKAALILGIDKTSIQKGIAKTVFPARLEVLSKNPLVILDGAHNENGADVLADYLDEHKLSPVTIMGMMADKNCEVVIQKIASRSKALYTVKVEGNPRTETAEKLAQTAKKYCDNSTPINDYITALDSAVKKAREQALPLLICGSLYLASDIRDMIINYLKK